MIVSAAQRAEVNRDKTDENIGIVGGSLRFASLGRVIVESQQCSVESLSTNEESVFENIIQHTEK